jgi:hypothetical protein
MPDAARSPDAGLERREKRACTSSGRVGQEEESLISVPRAFCTPAQVPTLGHQKGILPIGLNQPEGALDIGIQFASFGAKIEGIVQQTALRFAQSSAHDAAMGTGQCLSQRKHDAFITA